MIWSVCEPGFGDEIACFKYQNTANDINKHMLFNEESRSKYTQRHHDGNRKVPAWCFFHAKSRMYAAPAFQTVNGWKKIYRCINLINQTHQLLADSISCDFRTCQCSWPEKKENQTEHFGNSVTVHKSKTKRFPFSGNQQIIYNPLEKSQNIEDNKRWKKGIRSSIGEERE